MIRMYTILFSVFMVTGSQAQTSFNKAKADSLFDVLAAKNLAIGSVAITANGQLLYQRVFGKDQFASTEYRIGSITKMFTAVMIFQLMEQKKLLLTDSLSRYFPELPNAGQITIEQLLRHRSGLANFTSNTGYDNWKDQPKTHQELLAFIKNRPVDFVPGAQADYNNSNYLLLGYIIEKILQIPYKEALNERVIRKIALHHTYYGSQPGFGTNEAISYKYFDSKWVADKAVILDNFGGAGAVISTPADMCAFINGVFANQLISKKSLQQMITMVDGYGMGIFPYGDSLHPGFGHNGKTEGFASSLSYYPGSKIAIAYCTSGEVYAKDSIVNDLFKICFNQPLNIPSFSSVAVSKELLEKYTGTYRSADSSMLVTITSNDNLLTVETRGHAFQLEAFSANEFRNLAFGFFFTFSDDGERLLIRDAGDVYRLKK